VTGIEQGAGSVTVTTASGANFTARYAILTASLGVLKDGAIDFQPPLLPAKLAAIDEMGFGVLDKAVFVFDAPFWDEQADFILRQMDDWSGRW
jgi:lysine-specific histone demethylase 1